MKKEKTHTPHTRATMRGVPGDAARRSGLRRILLPLVLTAFVIGLGMGAIAGDVDVLPWWVGLILLLASFAELLYYHKQGPRVAYSFFKGARGEEMSASSLARLSADWTIFNGLITPQGNDIDHVVVGPLGIFVVETKHWSGEVDLINGEILANGRTLAIHRSPIAQVRRSMAAIAEITQLPVAQIHGILCFAGKQFLDATKFADEVAVCSHLNLEQHILSVSTTLDAKEIARVIARLNTLNIIEGL